jgi:dynein heavy chain
MYQFSLDWYRGIFKQSINEAKQNSGQQDKIQTIIKCHVRNVYLSTCRSLFECHKLLLAFQLTIKMKESEGEIDPLEYLFFLKGASGNINKDIAIPKPNADWIQESAWNQLQELD